MARAPIGGSLAIEVELMRERSSALRRVGHTLESLSAKLHELHSAIERGDRPRASAIAEYRDLYAEAEKQRWYLIVQREAMGLHHHGELDIQYPLPPRLTR